LLLNKGVFVAVPGRLWEHKKSDIEEALKKRRGLVTKAAKDLKVKYDTIMKYINEDPELVELLHKLRTEYEEVLLDTAEDVLMHTMSKIDTDPNNALKSSFFVLNSKGDKRGYKNTGATHNTYLVAQDPTKINASNSDSEQQSSSRS